MTAGENPEMVVFDPTGSGTFYVPNSGDETITVFGTPTGPAISPWKVAWRPGAGRWTGLIDGAGGMR